jgi:hypothetical protein
LEFISILFLELFNNLNINLYTNLNAKNRKSCGLDNLPMELWKFGGNELKLHILELFNEIADKKSNAIRMGERNGDKRT